MSRRYELDLCRITACIMVIIIHAGSALYHSCPLYEPAFVPLCFISTAVRGSVPVFFMLTGLLMLSREKLALGHFFRRHVLRLAGLFLFWSVLYALGSRFSSGSFGSAYDFFYSVMAGHYHMWFIAAMVTCCLFIPILYAAIRGAKLDTRWLLGVFLFLVLLMQNCNLTPDPAYILNRFTLNFTFDYLPYLLYIIWGWYLGQREYGRRTLWARAARLSADGRAHDRRERLVLQLPRLCRRLAVQLFLPAELHHGKRDVLLFSRPQGACFQAWEADTPALRLHPRRLPAAPAYAQHS